MNPTGTSQKSSLLMGTQPAKESTSAADRILADAKRVTEMPQHVVKPQESTLQTGQAGQTGTRNANLQGTFGSAQPDNTAGFDVVGFINKFEAEALGGQFGHLGTGDYDKLLSEKIQEHMVYAESVDTKIQSLVASSVKRYAGKTEKRTGK